MARIAAVNIAEEITIRNAN